MKPQHTPTDDCHFCDLPAVVKFWDWIAARDVPMCFYHYSERADRATPSSSLRRALEMKP